MRKLRNGIVIVLLIVSCIGQLLAEVYHTFNSNRLRVYCGESSKSGLVNLRQVVNLNPWS